MSSQESSSSSSDETTDCPMCLEELDLTDLNFKPCTCGYQMCRFCWHRIKELDGKCPHCRKPYDPSAYTFTPPNPEELEKIKKEKKQKEKSKKGQAMSRKHLNNVRVIQRNLVYVTNVPLNVAKEETIKKHFSQYGKIMKVVINRHVYNSDSPSGPSVSCYITYFSKEDALKAITAVNGTTMWGKQLRASFGTTKYCTFFLKFMPCPNPECMYLHELGGDKDSFTKEEMNMGKHLSEAAQSTPSVPKNPTISIKGSLSKSTDGIPIPEQTKSQVPAPKVSEAKGWNVSNTATKPKRELDNNEWPSAMEAVKSAHEKTPTSALPATASWASNQKVSNSAWGGKIKSSSDQIPNVKPQEVAQPKGTDTTKGIQVTKSLETISPASGSRNETQQSKTNPPAPITKPSETKQPSGNKANNESNKSKQTYQTTQQAAKGMTEQIETPDNQTISDQDEQLFRQQLQQEEAEEEERDRQFISQWNAMNQKNTFSSIDQLASSSSHLGWKGPPFMQSLHSNGSVEEAELEQDNWNETTLGIVELLLNDKTDESKHDSATGMPWNQVASMKPRPQSRFNFAQESTNNPHPEGYESQQTDEQLVMSRFNNYSFQADSNPQEPASQPVDWFKSILPHVNVSFGTSTTPSPPGNPQHLQQQQQQQYLNGMKMRAMGGQQQQQQGHDFYRSQGQPLFGFSPLFSPLPGGHTYATPPPHDPAILHSNTNLNATNSPHLHNSPSHIHPGHPVHPVHPGHPGHPVHPAHLPAHPSGLPAQNQQQQQHHPSPSHWGVQQQTNTNNGPSLGMYTNTHGHPFNSLYQGSAVFNPPHTK